MQYLVLLMETPWAYQGDVTLEAQPHPTLFARLKKSIFELVGSIVRLFAGCHRVLGG